MMKCTVAAPNWADATSSLAGDIKDDDVLEAELLRERESRDAQQAEHTRPTPLSE